MSIFLKRVKNTIKWVLIVLVAGSILLVLLFRFCPVYTSPLMFIRTYEQISRGEQIRWHHSWVPLDSISPYLPLAVLSSEDQNFLNHNGFDWEAIEKVVKERAEGERFRGGSTISQQTAKNVFLFPTSSSGKLAWFRKGVEAYFTVLIEFLWGKKRILEVYLNVIELGEGIYGVEAASQYYFSRSADALSSAQINQLVRIIPCPLCQIIR